LYRRIDVSDVVSAHLSAARRAVSIGFGRYVVTATSPFGEGDLAELAVDAPAVVARLFPDQPVVYERLGWAMFPTIERVYVNSRALADLGWTPRYDYRTVLDLVGRNEDPRSPLAVTIGAKGYHATPTGPYTT
jgi:nucleoside-diphosphate-sugar epimerase